jgi:hypothetical protein
VIETAEIAVVLEMLAAAAIVASIRLGMLIGMDRALEARVSIGAMGIQEVPYSGSIGASEPAVVWPDSPRGERR